MSALEPDPAGSVLRVMVVDDHTAVRQGLVAVLDEHPHLSVVGEAADGEAALSVAAQVQPHVVVMDLQMPRMDGVAATRELRCRGSAAQVLVLSACADRARIAAAVDAGAVGVLSKDVTVEELVAGVRAAAEGRPPEPRGTSRS